MTPVIKKYIKLILMEDVEIDKIFKPKVVGPDACKDCKGTGKYIGAGFYGGVEICDTCKGSGSSKYPAISAPTFDPKKQIQVVNPLYVANMQVKGSKLKRGIKVKVYRTTFNLDKQNIYDTVDLYSDIYSELSDDKIVEEARPKTKLELIDFIKNAKQKYGSTHVLDRHGYIEPRDEKVKNT